MKIMSIVVIIILISFVLFTYMSYAANRKVERQHYDLVKKEDGFEIRFYPKTILQDRPNH